MENFKTQHFLLVLFVFGLLIYANSWQNGFVWDDQFLVIENYYLRDWRHLFDIFTRNLRYFDETIRCNFYRPLQALSYRLDYIIWRFNPFGYHLTNTFLHLSVSILLYLLVNLIAKNRITALLTSLFFLVHPLHTEAVSYISGRAEPLAAFFLLLSWWLFVKYTTSGGKINYYFGSLLSFFLALLSKEISLAFPFFLLAWFFCFRDKAEPAEKLPYISHPYLWFFSLGLGYLFLRLSVLNFAGSLILASRDGFALKTLAFLKAFLCYLKLLFFPHNLHLEHKIPLPHSFLEPEVLFSPSLLGAIIALIVLSLRRGQSLIAFGLIWFFIFLLPVANLIPLEIPLAEHWLYLPSMGIFLLFALTIIKLYRLCTSLSTRRLFVFLVILILATYSSITVGQNLVWKDSFTLYKHILKCNPESFIIHNNLGIIYFHNGFVDLAIAEFKQALELKPDYVNTINNLGNVYTQK